MCTIDDEIQTEYLESPPRPPLVKGTDSMRIRNCFLALSLLSTLPFELMAADASARVLARAQKGQQTPATTEGSKCKRVGQWLIGSCYDIVGTAGAAVQYDRIDNTYGPQAAGSQYLGRIGTTGRVGTGVALAGGAIALASDAVGIYAVITDNPHLEQRACRVAAVCRAGAFFSEFVGNAPFWHTDLTYSPQSAELASAIDEVEERGAVPLVLFGLITISAACDCVKGWCTKAPKQGQQQAADTNLEDAEQGVRHHPKEKKSPTNEVESEV